MISLFRKLRLLDQFDSRVAAPVKAEWHASSNHHNYHHDLRGLQKLGESATFS